MEDVPGNKTLHWANHELLNDTEKLCLGQGPL